MFTRALVLIFIITQGFLSVRAFASAISNRMDSVIVSSGLKKSYFGVWVHDDAENKVIFDSRGHDLMIPASLSKIMTAAAALDAYPPETRFKTEIFSTAKIKEGTLAGPIYVKGGGDPSLVSERLWTLADRLYYSGVRRIEGDVVVDDTLFDSLRFDADRDSVRVDRAYDAPIGALSFNWNSVNVYARPAEKPGQPAQVFADPESNYIKLSSNAKTSSKSGEKSIGASRSQLGERDRLVVSGSIGTGLTEAVVYKSISQPEFWTGENVLAFLNRRGIQVTGKVRAGKTPNGSTSLVEVEGATMGEIVTSMMKFSNNYIAEMLTKQMALKSGPAPATMKAGIERIHDYLTRAGVKSGTYTFVNASGLTLDNRMSPAQIGQVLLSVKQNAVIFPEFLTALPIAGVDGTLKSRMRGRNSDGRIRAKTGLLRQGGVASLGGFASLANGSVRTFVILYNAPKEIPDLDKVWRTMDRLALEVSETE